MPGAPLAGLTHLPLLARFSVAMLILFTIPLLCRPVRLPAVIGLMAAGVLIGPFGLQLAPKHGDVVEFFAELGKLLLMFFAGLEIDLVQFNRTRNRSVGFGLLTFALPLTAGLLVGFGAKYPWVGALLIGSLLASLTLIAYPIVEKLGKLRNEAVTVTIGATVFTDVAALLVLAVCIPIHVARSEHWADNKIAATVNRTLRPLPVAYRDVRLGPLLRRDHGNHPCYLTGQDAEHPGPGVFSGHRGFSRYHAGMPGMRWKLPLSY
jgi:Kef-type K+ transport system membrane component KefB